MILRSISFSEHRGNPREWSIDGLDLRDVNLVVGRNAAGKSRSLAIIANLSRLLSGRLALALDGRWSARFDDSGTEVCYDLEVAEKVVVREEFRRAGEALLTRSETGAGKARSDRLGMDLEFELAPGSLAAVARRDAIQHPFLAPLGEWASAYRHYNFGGRLGKENLALIIPDAAVNFDPADENATTVVFRRGERDLPGFKERVIDDCRAIDYDVTDIVLTPPISLTLDAPFSAMDVRSLGVAEVGIGSLVDQAAMSSGMFRALSVLIHFNYALMSGRPSCLSVDDIGEGLDFERSCKLIDVLVGKARSSSVQLLLSTNDRFVMNRVPIEDWSLLKRVGNRVRVHNYGNSKERFDDFQFTGLNNFDFFATDFISEGLGDDDEADGDLRGGLNGADLRPEASGGDWRGEKD